MLHSVDHVRMILQCFHPGSSAQKTMTLVRPCCLSWASIFTFQQDSTLLGPSYVMPCYALVGISRCCDTQKFPTQLLKTSFLPSFSDCLNACVKISIAEKLWKLAMPFPDSCDYERLMLDTSRGTCVFQLHSLLDSFLWSGCLCSVARSFTRKRKYKLHSRQVRSQQIAVPHCVPILTHRHQKNKLPGITRWSPSSESSVQWSVPKLGQKCLRYHS